MGPIEGEVSAPHSSAATKNHERQQKDALEAVLPRRQSSLVAGACNQLSLLFNSKDITGTGGGFKPPVLK